jgi:tripartite-type tricarboxylate transporter receptor subunit TctC
MPAPIVARLNTEIKTALATAEVRKFLEDAAQRPVGNSPEEFAAMIRKGLDDWTRAVKTAGIKPE